LPGILPGTIDCSFNLVTNQLTSGYYGGEDRVKPNSSKCSHGGITDTSSFLLTGGINKRLQVFNVLSPFLPA
jgi:hypothetical protein